MIVEPTSYAQIKSLHENGATLRVSVMNSDFIITHPLRLGATLFIPVHHKDRAWIERIGPNKKERLASLIKLRFSWDEKDDLTLKF